MMRGVRMSCGGICRRRGRMMGLFSDSFKQEMASFTQFKPVVHIYFRYFP